MEKGEAPSPAPSNTLHQSDDVLHSGFQQLIQHNAASTSYPQLEQQPVDIGSHMGSNPHSRYSSPAPQTHMMTGYEHHTPINHASPYPAPPYAGGYQMAYPLDPSPYPQLPDSSTASHNAYSTPATSPPTPVQAEGMTTRSGRAIMRPGAASTLARPARIDKQPSKARAKKRKRIIGEDGLPEQSSIALANPLSQLVKNMTNVTDTDIQAYVNRSPEDRRREVAQSKTGKVKRPMNAFMLYRKAYQNRTKEWKRLDDIRRKEESAGEGKPEKGHDNHQVISQVCGMSWNMEPQELRDQYDEWAKVERNNHKIAFPDYKFAPAKSKIKKLPSGGGTSGSPHGDRESDEENASDLGAYDFQEWGQSSSGPPSRNATRSAEYVLPPGYPHSVYTSPSPGLQAARLPGAYGAQPQLPHQSSFQYSNPGKPRPADYGSALGQGQYYQQSTEFTQQTYPQHYGGHAPAYGMHHHQGIPAYVENVYINKTNSPASSFHNSPVLNHHTYNDLMASSGAYAPQISHPHTAMPHPQPHHMPRHPAEHNVDPSLSLMSMRQEPGGRGGGGGGNSNIAHDSTYDSLGILGLGQGGDFATDGLPTYHLDQGAGGFGGSHMGSPHPQQFEQAYHTPNDTSTTPGAEGSSDPAPHMAESSWQDGQGGAADTKIGASDWETTLGGAAEFQLEDIDQILGTTTDSPGG
ncbi:hypothetical protein F4801DRAFT_578944 [Xylaria longipes]|nr:hypothetical protein F4801DRAFT_578944 [Xylaria longipes]RYC60440.1 hypothetical protein CHU98_g5759 [Xylaria longipes]